MAEKNRVEMLQHDNDSDAEVLLQQINEIQALPTLSTVFSQVMNLLEDIDTTAEKLTTVIELDVSMVPKLLKLAISSFLGFSDKISDVKHAVMLLSFSVVRNAVLSLEVINAFDLKKKMAGFDISKFWQHCIAVAVISRYLDEQTGKRYREDVFTAGLIHDIGKVVMAHYFPDRFEKAWKSMNQEKMVFWESERRFFPVHHSAIGAILAERWKFPDRFISVAALHHTPPTHGGNDTDLVLTVHVADALANQYFGEGFAELEWPTSTAARKLMAEQFNTVEQWLPEIKDQIQLASDILIRKG